MKKLFFSILSIMAGMSAMSQTYNMEITLSDGTKQLIPADNVTEVRFVEANQDIPAEFNILTEEYIPDAVLRSAIKDQVAGGSETLTNVEAASYEGGLMLSDYKISNFKGIGYLTSLTSLIANSVFAKELDASELVCLRELSINRSLVENLILGSEKLEILNIGATGLKNFDLSVLPKGMKDINVDNLGYMSLDFTAFPDIETINCSQNQLTDLRVAGLTNLKKIIFTTNDLAQVSFAGCGSLEFVAGSFNLNLTSLDLAGCVNIRNFMFMYTALESLDTTPFASTIEEINLGWSQVKSLNISNCSNLTYLALDNCAINEELDFSSCSKLDVLRVDGTEIPSLDLSACGDIAEIQCSTNSSLTSIKLAEHLTKLFQLNIDNVPSLQSFEWGSTDALQYANIYMTPLDRIDISKVNKDYYNLYLDYNDNLKEIKVWEGFDISNPPANIQKPAQAVFVYEFSEE